MTPANANRVFRSPAVPSSLENESDEEYVAQRLRSRELGRQKKKTLQVPPSHPLKRKRLEGIKDVVQAGRRKLRREFFACQQDAGQKEANNMNAHITSVLGALVSYYEADGEIWRANTTKKGRCRVVKSPCATNGCLKQLRV